VNGININSPEKEEDKTLSKSPSQHIYFNEFLEGHWDQITK